MGVYQTKRAQSQLRKMLNNKTVKELRNICKELGIKGYSRAKKADLIQMISEEYEGGYTSECDAEFYLLEDKEYEEVDNQPELMDNQPYEMDYVMFLERCFRIPYEYEVCKDHTDIMQELGRESRESCIARTIRSYNMPYPGTYKKKDNYTVYGASPKFEQSRLRRGYGDVFAVFVGGPCDTSPL